MFNLWNKQGGSRYAVLVLRAAIGLGFMMHGWAKLSRGPDQFADVLVWMQVPLPYAMAWLVTLIEVFGGIAMLIGAYVTLISLPLIAIHVVAMFGVHWQYGFSSVKTMGVNAHGPQFGPPGYEINIIYMAGLIAIMLIGHAGAWSIDGLRKNTGAVTKHKPSMESANEQ